MAPLRLAVVGVGHLGKEHARILSGLAGVQLVGVADVQRDQAEAVALRCGTRAYSDYRHLLDKVDGAVVVVPSTHHHAVAADFLRRGAAVLVEKPLAVTPAQAADLEELARRHGAVLQVGHVERFNPAVEELQRRPLRPKFVTCERLGPFSGRGVDVGVVLDLMIHDLDLLLALVGAPVRAVQALGVSVLGGHEDVARAHLVFENGCVADVTASRANPAPVRRMHLWGPEGYAGIDFARRRLRLVQPSEAFHRGRTDPRRLGPAGLAALKSDLFQGHLETLELDCDHGDQLTRELEEFVHCARTGARPRAGAREGREAVELAHRVLESIHTHAWEGHPDGPVGPNDLPASAGPLFRPVPDQAAA